MSSPLPSDLEQLRETAREALRSNWKMFLITGLVLIALGLAAVALPQLATLAIEIVVGWVLFIGGLFRLMSVLRLRSAPGFWLSLATAALATMLGVLLLLQPPEGVLTLTMALLIFFAADGIASVFVAIEHRRHLRNWGWTLASGIVNLFLVYLVWRGWPETAYWLIGLLVGINMLFLGLSLVMTALAARADDS